MAKHLKTGTAGEDLAVNYLNEHGYTVLARNFRFKRAEIDIIATRQNMLVFAEVKTRSSAQFGFPEDFVDSKKAELFLLAADEYIYQQQWQHDVRFDIISILKIGNQVQIHHIEDAFH